MRKAYEDAAQEFSRFVRIAPIDLMMGLAQMCQAIADAELVVQGKQHEATHQKEILMTATIYEREIAKLEREIAALNAKILTDCLTESEQETRDARNAWG